MNLCTTCGEDFGSIGAFDAHRVGKYPQSGPSEYVGDTEDWMPEKGRRCLDEEEMLAKGLTRNSRGRWSLPSSAALSKRYWESKATELEPTASDQEAA